MHWTGQRLEELDCCYLWFSRVYRSGGLKQGYYSFLFQFFDPEGVNPQNILPLQGQIKHLSTAARTVSNPQAANDLRLKRGNTKAVIFKSSKYIKKMRKTGMSSIDMGGR